MDKVGRFASIMRVILKLKNVIEDDQFNGSNRLFFRILEFS